jgi:arabinose-5-phosphate isomerase
LFFVSEPFLKVKQLLKLEADSINRASQRLDSASVEGAINLLSKCCGKVVVLGVGKSGIIANKIADTMTSTGTVAVFLHPSDAMHGSLGIVSKGDVVIALSNSGETDEIIALLPAIKAKGVSIISIVGNLNSTLARKSDVALDASVDQEACPLNLAPTASTTVALAIGDALAMTLMEAKNLTLEDFASNHPAGRIGKRLTIRVADLMHESPNVSPRATWLEVVSAISKFGLGAVNVVGDDGKLGGIITDGDLRRLFEKISAEKIPSLAAEEIMTKNPIVTKSESLAYEALQLMENRPSQISVLPVIEDGNRCIGLIRLHDIVRSGL